MRDLRGLAPILEDLCAKYGDIIPESTFQRSGLRTIYVNTLCEMIMGMCTTRVSDISEEELSFWWRHLKTLQFIVKKNNEDIDREIKDVSQDIKELEAKVVAQKEKLVALEEIRKGKKIEVAEFSCLHEVEMFSCIDSGISHKFFIPVYLKQMCIASREVGNYYMAYKHFIEKLDSSTYYSSLTLWEGNEDAVNELKRFFSFSEDENIELKAF
ncbi:unnamed protein product [Dovyalis caffra]|uniref:Uncharacterized protein n=1 Tax=Dovyalis caffra TaxID=77055 RepID=A0AAV1RP54_9ROSI|nr:unnamed protein product [Dovyalis caffra]